MIVEHVLEQGLAGIEIAFDRQRMHVFLVRCGHLLALHVRHAAIGKQDEHVHIVEAAKRLDRGGPGIARRGADDGHTLAAPGQGCLKQLADQLHGEILEGKRRPVKQLQQEMIRPQLHQRRPRGVAKALIGALDDAGQVLVGETVADERAHDPKRNLFIGAPGQGGNLGLAQGRDGLGQIQPAVAGQPGQHRLLKVQRGCSTPGRNVTHGLSFLSAGPPARANCASA